MSFGPTTRGETECTSASKTSAVGSSPVGVSTAAATAASTTVASGSVTRSCGSPIHPSRAMVQRVNGGSGPPSPAPRGCSAPSCSVATVTTSTPAETVETARCTTPPSQPDSSSPSTAAPPSPASLPHRQRSNTTSAAAAGAAVLAHGAQRSRTRDGVGAPVLAAVAASPSDTVLPPLTRTNLSHTFLNDPRNAIAAPVTAVATSSSSTKPSSVVLPAIISSHAASDRDSGKPAKRKSSSISAASTAATQLSLTTSPATLRPTTSVDAVRAANDSPPSSVDNSCAKSGSSGASSQSTGEPYFRDNNIPRLFNELSEALLEARPESPVAFMTDWLRRRREALE
ncbi:hypothetical protein ABB37_00212 [Leptomonas pyrrhocoris]|uniref:Uncharacterized protein n=1 Tax=Leptomonas pyrrhocoris TaxID=157538 RepID=A0A0N0VHU2_LEPPY|nr:hypothetical protein ABB37_00212 [Leptomonas pyrrhocoris]KPA85898.1 hypothetical protein ABB37_00212 [Leptomonas pyrrhocoris]|eukprot:XP_015664337.1 hypothetical protein ABB37_00212 [Leptomonas pyrrhocoris]